MGFIANTNQIANVSASFDATAVRNEIAGPPYWQAQLLTTDDGTMAVRVRKAKVWTQAPVTSLDPPAWGEFAPFDPPLKDKKIAKAIIKAMRR